MKQFIVIFFFFVLIACSEKIDRNDLDPQVLTLQTQSCASAEFDTVDLRCYQARRADGTRHRYPVRVLSAFNPTRESRSTAVLMLPGGPGQGGQTEADWLVEWASFLTRNELAIDLVLFDPPATKGSSAYWQCQTYEDRALALLAEDLSLEEEEEALSQRVLDCLARYDAKLKKSGFSKEGIQSLSTHRYTERIGYLLDALPYNEIHLLGVSYGSRLALALAAHPKVKTLTLDSVYPFSRGTLDELPELFAKVEARHIDEYRKRFNADYRELFGQAQSWLNTHPQEYRIERWDGSGATRILLNARRLFDLQFDVLYDEDALNDYYRGLRLLQSDPSQLTWSIEQQVNFAFDSSFSSLVFFATECQDIPNIDKARFDQAVAKYPELDVDWLSYYKYDLCRSDIFDRSSYVHNSAYIQKPTLLLSGEFDPVTPASWGGDVTENVTQSKQFVVTGLGHGVLLSDRCHWKGLGEYWQSASLPDSLDCNSNDE